MSISTKHAWIGLFLVILLFGVTSSALGQATVTTDKENYSPGDAVVITGSGWMPGETVSLTILADIPPLPPVILYATADENGNILNEEFVIGEEDTNTYFLLQAQGQTSGLSAETWFSADGVDADDQVAVLTDKGNYSLGETVVITGTGWIATELVSLSIYADSSGAARAVLYVTADDSGAIRNEEFIIGDQDSNTHFLLQADGQTSGLSAETQFANANIAFAPAVDYPVGTYPASVHATDLDGDGDNDLAVANLGSKNVSILRNYSNGTFAAAVSYPVGTNPSSVYAADLDGDGDDDLAIAHCYSTGYVVVLRNNGNGTFAQAGYYYTGKYTQSVHAADLDGDGDYDLAATSWPSNDVWILRNNGNGTFAPGGSYAVGNCPWSVHAADLDGDGDYDLAAANMLSNNVSILRNNGNGTFAPAVSYPVGARPKSVHAADLDGDGDYDLAVANEGSNSISVLPNNGNGTFAPAVFYVVGTCPLSVHAADLDDDGDRDLAVANIYSNSVSVLCNHGNGTFAPAIFYPVGAGAKSVYAADLDGDGDYDLAVANYLSNDVSVLINITPPNLPPVAINDTYATDEDITLGIAPPGVLANDDDPDGNPLTAVLVQGAANGLLTLNADGSFQYVPNPNWHGIDTFTYKAFDGTAYSNVATVTVEVTPVNDPPTPAIDPLPVVSGECPGPVIVPIPTANDDNDGVIAGTTSDPVTYTAPGTYTVHWSYTDAGGLTTTQDQTVEVVDNTAPEITCPPDSTFRHGETIDFGEPTATDACDADVAITFTDVTIPGSCPVDYTITRTWKASDDCGNFATCVQTVTVLCPGATPPGSNVVVRPVDSTTGTTPVTVTFDSVLVGGMTTLETSGAGAPPPFGFKLGNPPTYYELETTAVYTDSVTVCIDYTGVYFGTESKLRLFHLEAGHLEDCTASLDTVANVICGRVSSLSAFAIFEELVAAAVDIDPDVLNPRSGGRWVTSYIELPEGYDPVDIDVSTVILNDAVPAEMSPTSVGDYDSDGVRDRMVKFSRSAVIDTLPHGEYVEVRIGGQVGSEGFLGRDTIRVLMPKLVYPNGGELLQPGKRYALTWEVPGGYTPDYYDVFYTTDDGNNWVAVAEDVSGTSCNWTVPPVLSARCRVLVEAYDDKGIMGYDLSDRTFVIGTNGTSRPRNLTPIAFDLRLAGLNPSVLGATLEFDLPEALHVRAVVFDVGGRLVKELMNESRPAGSHLIKWNGKNASGDAVPAGIYLVRVEAGEYIMTKKVVLAR